MGKNRESDDLPASRSSAVAEKLELVRYSYAEVLDATKHQDDKIGRFLTAIAFLTTGAIALLFGGDLLPVRFALNGDIPFPGSYPLVGWATAGFFFCVLGSVAMLLLCLSAPLRLPGKQLDWGPSLTGSRLFFSYIGSEAVDGWSRRWHNRDCEAIERQLLRQYVLETHNLAERARLKYQHTNEASALFVLSLLFLGTAVALAISAAVSGPIEATQSIEVGRWTSLGVGIVAAAHTFAQLYARVVHDRRSFQLVRDAAISGPGSEADDVLRAARSVGWLLLTVPAFVLALAVPSASPWERRVAFGVASLLVIGTFIGSYPRWKRADKSRKMWRSFLYGVVPVSVAAVSLGLGGVFQILGVLVAPTWLSTLSISDNYRRSVRAQAHTAEAARKSGANTDSADEQRDQHPAE